MAAAAGIVQAGGTMFNADQQAQAMRQQGRYQERMGYINQRFNELVAEQTEKAGQEESYKAKRAGQKAIGAQRARLAAAGVDVNSGTAAAIQADTKARSEADMLTVQNNSWREAWGLRLQGESQAAAGRMARMTGNMNANATLLAGGLQATGQGLQAYDDYRYPKGRG